MYYHQASNLMILKSIGELTGGIIFGILLAILTDNPEALGSAMASEASGDIATAGNLIKQIAKDEKALQKTAVLREADVDKLHQVIRRPDSIDDGAEHLTTVKLLKGCELSSDLTHPSGEGCELPFQEAENFHNLPKPKLLQPGTKIYRIVDSGEYIKTNGAYWSYVLPKNLKAWRSGYAVKASWNKNGYFVEHTVGEEGLPVWEGEAASQMLAENGFKDWVLRGGEKQIFVPNSKELIPNNLNRQQTNWEN